MSLLNKLYAYMAGLGALALAIGYAFLRGRSEGKEVANAKQAQETHKLDEAFQKIDASETSFDGAIEDLVGRAKRPKP